MAAKLVQILKDVDWDSMDLDGLKEVMRDVTKLVQEEMAEITKKAGRFNDKHIGKPIPWDGEKEEEFKAWNEKFTTFMANAGDKKWRKIMKTIQSRGDSEDLEEMDDVEEMITDIGIDQDEAEELLEILYDQLTQYTTGELFGRRAHAWAHGQHGELQARYPRR